METAGGRFAPRRRTQGLREARVDEIDVRFGGQPGGGGLAIADGEKHRLLLRRNQGKGTPINPN